MPWWEFEDSELIDGYSPQPFFRFGLDDLAVKNLLAEVVKVSVFGNKLVQPVVILRFWN